MSGYAGYADGLAAEDCVVARYERAGSCVAARRWRGKSGEVDLIVRDGIELVFVEVKKARDFARAAERLTARQMARIYRAASEFLAGEPDGQLTAVRFDVAFVNSQGETDILQNVQFA